MRLDTVIYPNGREIHYDYGAAGAIDDIMSRLTAILDDDGTTTLASYKYLGAGTVVTEDYEGPDVKLDYNANGNLGGFDRFGRVVDQIWEDYGGQTPVAIDQYRYGHDRAGNRLWRENVVAGNQIPAVHLDELYAYDPVDRLIAARRGDLNAAHDAILSGTLGFEQNWDLDGTGNFSGFGQDTDGDGILDLVQRAPQRVQRDGRDQEPIRVRLLRRGRRSGCPVQRVKSSKLYGDSSGAAARAHPPKHPVHAARNAGRVAGRGPATAHGCPLPAAGGGAYDRPRGPRVLGAGIRPASGRSSRPRRCPRSSTKSASS